MDKNKYRILLLSAAAVIAIILLPASYRQLKIMRQNVDHSQTSVQYADQFHGKELSAKQRGVIYVIYTAVILGTIVYLFVTGRIIRSIGLSLGVAALFLVFLIKNPNPNIQIPINNKPVEVQETKTEQPPQPPEERHWAWVSLVFVTAVLFIVFISVFKLIRNMIKNRHYAVKQVALEAQKTLEEIKKGADLKELIIRCYFEMTQILENYHKLERSTSMTARDFETYLQKAGFFIDDISRLSRLFEKARYGRKKLDEKEEKEAILSLEAIAGFYGSK